MTERPIIMRAEEMQVIPAGRQTQIRRVVKPQPPDGYDFHEYVRFLGDLSARFENRDPPLGMWTKRCPYGQPGDMLWVRETWRPDPPSIEYRADGWTQEFRDEDGEPLPWFRYDNGRDGWRPSIHMPKWACRLWLRVTDVRVERVQDISLDDCIAEGISCPSQFVMGSEGPTENPSAENWEPDAAFAALWDAFNARRGFGWEANPWVWVLGIEVV